MTTRLGYRPASLADGFSPSFVVPAPINEYREPHDEGSAPANRPFVKTWTEERDYLDCPNVSSRAQSFEATKLKLVVDDIVRDFVTLRYRYLEDLYMNKQCFKSAEIEPVAIKHRKEVVVRLNFLGKAKPATIGEDEL
jgi:hypothetical protein